MLPDYVEDFLESLETDGLKLSSIKRYRADLQKFFQWLEDNALQTDLEGIHSISIIEVTKYVNYISNLNYSDDTVRRLNVVLNRFFSHLGIYLPSNANLSVTPSKRDLIDTDFVSEQDMKKLYSSMKRQVDMSPGLALAARNRLIDRNISIVYLIRVYGLTPADIHSIDMNQVNFAQSAITVNQRIITISSEHIGVILRYFNDIPEALRPRYRTQDPLFVAYYNSKSEYRFDYRLGHPSRLSIRSIQHMIQSEVSLARIRGITATNLRNTCILEMIKSGKSEEELVHFFGFKNGYSINRYKKYLNSLPNNKC